MFFKRADWASNGFPRELFHDSKSKRGGVLMHSKVWLLRLNTLVRMFIDLASPDDSRDTATQTSTLEC
jgi:hypothetical protein